MVKRTVVYFFEEITAQLKYKPGNNKEFNG
jgi:hypothetical protein